MPNRPPAKVATIPAPIGGWNARDPMPAMQPEDAVILDNWIPSSGGVSLRNGYAHTATGFTSPVQSLMEYRATSGTSKLFAASGACIFDITAGGVFDPATDFIIDGLSNAKWQQTLFENSAGQFMIACNGQDNSKIYDGSAWADLSITGSGIESANFINVNVHVHRLWFIEKNALNAWYLGIDAISGDITKFPLGAVAKKGGALVAMASWTRDGGSGPDDVAVFITNAGEAILYAGTDPDTADAWNLVGIFNIAKPIGYRCAVKSGADVGIITSQGALALSSVLPLSISSQTHAAVTDKIYGAFADAYKYAGDVDGWQIIEHPKSGLVLINVPQTGGTTSYQYVMNSANGAWCRFKGLNALCFSLMGDDLYFGTQDGKVHKMSSDYEDDGQPIEATVLPAFSDFKTAGNKRFTMARPQFNAVQGTELLLEIRTNYQTTPFTTFPSVIPEAGSTWDEAIWDEASWGPSIDSFSEWQMVEGIGRTGSYVVSVASRTPITLNETDMMYEPGGVL